MPDEGSLSGPLFPGQGPEWEPTLQNIRVIIETLAEADKHRSDNETQRYQLAIESRDRQFGKGFSLVRTGLWMIFALLLILLGFAIYAYATGNPGVATHTVSVIGGALLGFFAGLGFRRTR